MFETTISDGILRVHREGTRWLSCGWDGGFERGPVAYNVSVPGGWERTDLDAYVAERRNRAGFERAGPTLLTGVDLEHARGARYGPVEVYATAGISNPGALPIEGDVSNVSAPPASDDHANPGTVNLVVGTDRSLGDGALTNLLAVAVEAKTATLLAETGFPGTTTDAAIVGCDPTGASTEYVGSVTEVGAAVRACTRDAVLASLRSRYVGSEYPSTVEDAEHGTRTTVSPDVFSI